MTRSAAVAVTAVLAFVALAAMATALFVTHGGTTFASASCHCG